MVPLLLGVGNWELGVDKVHFLARSSLRRNSAAYASFAAREPSTQPITMPMRSTAGMKMKCAEVISVTGASLEADGG